MQRVFNVGRRAVKLSSVSPRRRFLTESYSRGPAEPPLLEQTVGEHFASIVSRHGDRPAVISRHQHQRLSYDSLDRKSNALAHGLANIGVKKGARVAVSLGNNVEYATATYALFKLGAILVPLNPAFTASQVIAALRHLNASLLIIGTETKLPRKAPQANIGLLRQIVPNLEGNKIESELIPSLRNIVIVDNSHGRVDVSSLRSTESFENVIEDGESNGALSSQGLDPDEVVNIQFTSGTTSMPKAACLTHRSILNNGKSIGDRMLLTPNDIVCCPPPLFHCFGCILGYMATATHGSSIVFPSEAFDARATLRSVQEERCTALYGVPTMFVAELELLQNGTISYEGFQHLRTGIAAGSSIPAELMRKLHHKLNLTELMSAMTTTDDPVEKRIDSVGRLLPHVEAKVMDPSDHGRILPIGQRGEVAVSGYLVMKEYWNDSDKTAEVKVADEAGKVWMHTGDEGLMDRDGYIKITGRIKDVIIKGGENIHPLEIENTLFGHPAVKEVSVVGVPDERYGEVVAAFVIPQNDPNVGESLTKKEVREWVEKRLGRFMVPKYVFFVDNYPKTASGKIQKFKLREDGTRRVQNNEGLD
ncbi:MAG: hypothetical protein M1837_007562 [Sclerophora amabilis]|nr:MAG: hypothetical protein M1837_007562 [Sclerophora amabilis]